MTGHEHGELRPAPFVAPSPRVTVHGSPAIPGPLLAGILAVYTGVLPAPEVSR